MPDRPRPAGALPGVKVHRLRRVCTPAPAPRGAPRSTAPARPGPKKEPPRTPDSATPRSTTLPAPAGEAAFATAHAPQLLPDAPPALPGALKGHVRQLRQLLGVWNEGVRSLEQTLSLIEVLCDSPAPPAGEAGGSANGLESTLAPLLQSLLAQQKANGVDLAALLANPALAGLLGRQS